MFRARTLFVVGAGASSEVGLPIGSELLARISKLLNFHIGPFSELEKGDRIIFDALKELFPINGELEKLNEHITAGRVLNGAAQQALSIDNLVHSHEDPVLSRVAKLAIVRVILDSERTSGKFVWPNGVSQSLKLSEFDDTWYRSFTALICEGIQKSQIADIFENLAIVNFNYDRCLEAYLPSSIANYFNIGLEEAKDIVRRLKILRPYGMAGKLPWQDGDIPVAEFGESGKTSVMNVFEGINTFTEGLAAKSDIDEIRNLAAWAERIVFLGFGFHRQNLEVLRSRNPNYRTQVLATVGSMSQSDQTVVRREIGNELGIHARFHDTRIELAPIHCKELFQNYWRTLTAERM